MENKAIEDFLKYYPKNKIPKIQYSSFQKRIEGLQNIMQIQEGYAFIYLDNYFILTANELEMINNLDKYTQHSVLIENAVIQLPNLQNQYVTFVGAGFPLSGILINILTGAKINLIEIDQAKIEKAIRFCTILSEAGIINLEDFSFIHADGQKISYSKGKIKTDILHLASALPNVIKKEIFKNIAKEKANHIIIIDRYVSGIFKLLYDHKVYSKDIPDFKTVAKIYPANLYKYKKNYNQNIVVKPTSIKNLNSSRLILSN